MKWSGWAFLLLGSALIVYMIFWALGFFMWSADVTVVLFGGFAILLVLSGIVRLRCNHPLWFREPGAWATFVRIATCAGVIAVVATQAMILFGIRGQAPTNAPCDTVIVLGARLVGDRPGVTLQSRLYVAKQTLEANPQAIAIVCGGQGDDEPIPEAQAMRDWLVQQGIAPERVIMESTSRNTYQNISNARELHPTLGRIMLVSSDYHLYRAKRIAERVGLDDVSICGSQIAARIRLLAHTRETCSILREFFMPET